MNESASHSVVGSEVVEGGGGGARVETTVAAMKRQGQLPFPSEEKRRGAGRAEGGLGSMWRGRGSRRGRGR